MSFLNFLSLFWCLNVPHSICVRNTETSNLDGFDQIDLFLSNKSNHNSCVYVSLTHSFTVAVSLSLFLSLSCSNTPKGCIIPSNQALVLGSHNCCAVGAMAYVIVWSLKDAGATARVVSWCIESARCAYSLAILCV